MSDSISRQQAIAALHDEIVRRRISEDANDDGSLDEFDTEAILRRLPSAQLERDIPKKPNETTDRTWGIPHRQAVCPNCDRYIGTMYFIGEGKRKISYCDSCGQAIDWEGWGFDE